MAYAYNIATWETEIRRITVQGHPRKIVCETPISKITRAKWTGDVAQAVELLLCNCKTLSSNPTPTKYIYVYIMFKMFNEKASST
jgi:hypothetical protein